jgi:hypothetical protein
MKVLVEKYAAVDVIFDCCIIVEVVVIIVVVIVGPVADACII